MSLYHFYVPTSLQPPQVHVLCILFFSLGILVPEPAQDSFWLFPNFLIYRAYRSDRGIYVHRLNYYFWGLDIQIQPKIYIKYNKLQVYTKFIVSLVLLEICFFCVFNCLFNRMIHISSFLSI